MKHFIRLTYGGVLSWRVNKSQGIHVEIENREDSTEFNTRVIVFSKVLEETLSERLSSVPGEADSYQCCDHDEHQRNREFDSHIIVGRVPQFGDSPHNQEHEEEQVGHWNDQEDYAEDDVAWLVHCQIVGGVVQGGPLLPEEENWGEKPHQKDDEKLGHVECQEITVVLIWGIYWLGLILRV